MEVISEDSINRWVVPHLSVGKRGSKLQVKASAVIGAILYRLSGRLPMAGVAHQGVLRWSGPELARGIPPLQEVGRGRQPEKGVDTAFAQQAQAARSLLYAVGRQPDTLQERRGVRGLPGQENGQNLQQPVSLRQQGCADCLQRAGLGRPP